MIRIGILGDIGSGKSYVAKSFGYPVFNADNEVGKLYKKDRKIFFKLNKALPKYITKFPIKISSLIDQLNARLIQQNYSAQSNININKYILDINSRILKKSDNELKLTEREIDTIIFLKNENKPVKVDVLQKKVWKYAEDLETHTVETHIYRLRKKIKDTFNDDTFIQSKKDGYIINE